MLTGTRQASSLVPRRQTQPGRDLGLGAGVRDRPPRPGCDQAGGAALGGDGGGGSLPMLQEEAMDCIFWVRPIASMLIGVLFGVMHFMGSMPFFM